MNYRLSHKVFGKKDPFIIFEFEVPLPIRDICYSKDNGFVFIAGSAIGILNEEGLRYPYIGNPSVNMYSCGYNAKFLFPTSIASYGEDIVYISQHGGRNILKIELHDKYSKDIINGSWVEAYHKLFANTQGEGTSGICTYKENVYWVAKDINRCFIWSKNRMALLGGNGRAGFSSANKAIDSTFNGPNDIFVNDGFAYIADMENHCVRVISNNGVRIVAGHPIETNISPRKVLVQNNFIYFLDKNTINSVNPKVQSKYTPFFKTDAIISMTDGPERGIYILEMINASN